MSTNCQKLPHIYENVLNTPGMVRLLLKNRFAKKCFLQLNYTYIKLGIQLASDLGVAPDAPLSTYQLAVIVSNSLILVNCKKCILNFTDTFNSWFCNLLYETYSHSFIYSFIFIHKAFSYSKCGSNACIISNQLGTYINRYIKR